MDLTNNSLPQLSYWEQQYLQQKFDYIIVGAGICGLFTAYFLSEKNPRANILVLDKQPFGNRASTKNAGFACFGSVGELLDDLSVLGKDRCAELLKMRLQGLKLLTSIIPKSAMHYTPGGGYEVFRADEMTHFHEHIHPGLKTVNNTFENILPQPYQFADIPKVLKGFDAAIYQGAEAGLNPFLLMSYLEHTLSQRNCKILRGITVTGFDENGSSCLVHSSIGSLLASKLIATTNLNAFKNRLPSIKATAARAQVLISEPLGLTLPTSVFHAMAGYTYFRFVDGRLLLGGMRHRFMEDEFTEDLNVSSKVQESLHEYGQEILGRAFRVSHSWAGTMSVGEDRFPHIGSEGNLIYGLKMGGMGVAIGAYVGEKLSEICLESTSY